MEMLTPANARVHPSIFFYRATRAKYETAINKENGRALIINGDIYYSPNCQRTVDVPNRTRPHIKADPFCQPVSDYHKPMWWTLEYGHLAFLDLDASSGCAFASVLDVSLHFPKLKGGKFCLHSSIILSWKRLEFYLQGAAEAILLSNHVPTTPQVIQTALVCTGRFIDHHELRGLVTRSRDWFSYWFCRISYAIAVATSIDTHRERPHQDPLEKSFLAWAGTLKDLAWSQIFISSINNASGRFDPAVERVGLFMDLVNPEPDQFSVDWLCYFHVPVWYPWGPTEMGKEELAHFAPLSYQLQEIGTFLTTTPSLAAQTKPEWLIFRQDWERRREELKLVETAEHRHAREDREKNPSWKKGNVFEWTNIDGTYVRRKVMSSKEFEDILRTYGRNQRMYNGFTQEWDCCSQFGELEPDEIAQQDLDGSDYDDDWEPLVNSKDLGREIMVSTTPLLSAREVHQEYQAVNLLKEYFGFVPPLPLIPIYPKPVYDPAQRNRYTITLGLRHVDDQFFEDAVAGHAVKFLDEYAASRSACPSSEKWDLSLTNRIPLAAAKRLRNLRRVHDSLYYFDFGQDATVPWKLAVESATVALMVCRLDERLNDYGLAWTLIGQGIAVRTLLPLSNGQKIRPPPTMRIPVRFPGYGFDSSDYAAYLTNLGNLLRIPRIARAATQEGGIVWRIAFAHSSFANFLNGPTAQLVLHDLGRTFAPKDGYPDWCDDVCSEHELDAICGAYACYQEQRKEVLLKSWWPTAKVWRESYHLAFWNDYCENFFLKREQEISEGKAIPLTIKEWKKRFNRNGRNERIMSSLEGNSKAFISKYLP